MWTEITYTCGHVAREQVYGSAAERDKYAWGCAHYKVCPECYAKQREAEREAERKAAQTRAAEETLPELTGSSKQIAWAVVIRDRKIAEQRGCTRGDDMTDDMWAQVTAAWEQICQQTSAAWWIDHRSDSVAQILREQLSKAPQK